MQSLQFTQKIQMKLFTFFFVEVITLFLFVDELFYSLILSTQKMHQPLSSINLLVTVAGETCYYSPTLEIEES
jgi:hypothetical protein